MGAWNEYQLQPFYVGFAPQVLPEVGTLHGLIDETKRVCCSRIYPYEQRAGVGEEAGYVNFITKPLYGSRQWRIWNRWSQHTATTRATSNDSL